MQPYPFLKNLDFQKFQRVLGQLHLPKWMDDVSQICSQLVNTIGSLGPPTIKLQYSVQLPVDAQFIPFLFPVGFRFDHRTNTIVELLANQVLVPRVDLVRLQQVQEEQHIDKQLRNESEEGLNHPLVESSRVQLTEVEQIQITSSALLQYRVLIKSLSKKLDIVLAKLTANDSYSLEVFSGQNDKKLFDNELDSIRKLKKELLELDARIDVELTEYSSQCHLLFGWSDWNDLEVHKKEIGVLLSQISSSSIRQYLQELNVQPSPEEVLGDIIGLQSEVAAKIFSRISHHETEEDLIHRYFRDINNNWLQETSHDLPTETLLVKLGFTEQKAKYLSNKINSLPLLQDHFSVLDFVHLFIEDLFKYDLLLTDKLPNLPDRSQGSNTVYTAQAFANFDVKREINCCNFKQNGKLAENLDFFFSSVDEQSEENNTNEKFEYWFHGTDSAAASTIAELGIDIQKGAPKKDFSDGNGFYLSDNLDSGTEWAEKSFVANYSAVLRYKIPKELLAKRNDGITLRKNNKDEMKQWREIIRYNRSAKQEATRKLKTLLRSTSFIMGPLSNDGLWEQNQKNENWPKPLKNSWTQLCICNGSLADDFNLFLDKIAFIEKEEKKQISKCEANRQ
jgi:hypothetical protein